ncbi:MAG: putative sulfate exporter family transporter [bacterium]
MNKFFTNIKNILPGFALATVIAAVAYFIGYLLEEVVGIHLIGGSVIALFIGMVINYFWSPKILKQGLDFSSKKLLKLAIILLGLSLSIGMILEVGQKSLLVMVFTLLTCFGGGFIVGKLLKIDWKVSNLISAGTGICGGSAIAALSPVIEAKDNDVAIAMSATFIFDMVMIIVFPLLGVALNMTDEAFGLWAGTAVNDTSSVVAAAAAFSEAAKEFAVTVKLTRTLSIIPVVVAFSFINIRLQRKEAKAVTNENVEVNSDTTEQTSVVQVQPQKPKINFMKLIPWFILGFIGMAILNSITIGTGADAVSIVPTWLSSGAKQVSSFLMIIALAAIGLKTNIKEVKASGARPMIHGFIISLLVVVVALVVIMLLGNWQNII